MKEQNDLTSNNKEQTQQEEDLYTLAEIRKLSSKDVMENWDKVARSLHHISQYGC